MDFSKFPYFYRDIVVDIHAKWLALHAPSLPAHHVESESE